MKTERFREAAEDYKHLIKADPGDSQAMAGYIMALASYDVSSAESHESSLPPLDTTKSVTDMDKLESVVPGVKKTYKKTDAKRYYLYIVIVILYLCSTQFPHFHHTVMTFQRQRQRRNISVSHCCPRTMIPILLQILNAGCQRERDQHTEARERSN